MDGRGRALDNVFIERLWRSVKYECLYIHRFETEAEVRSGLETYFDFYNMRRPHQGLNGQKPFWVYNLSMDKQRL
jgi:putative transposase